MRHEEVHDPGPDAGAADLRALQDHGVVVVAQDGRLTTGLAERLLLEGAIDELENGDTVEHGSTSSVVKAKDRPTPGINARSIPTLPYGREAVQCQTVSPNERLGVGAGDRTRQSFPRDA